MSKYQGVTLSAFNATHQTPLDAILSPEYGLEATSTARKKRGRQKGIVQELRHLQNGGMGGRPHPIMRSVLLVRNFLDWCLHVKKDIQKQKSTICSNNNDSNISFEAAGNDSSDNNDNKLWASNNKIDTCVSDMKGSPIFPIEEVAEIFRKQVTCK